MIVTNANEAEECPAPEGRFIARASAAVVLVLLAVLYFANPYDRNPVIRALGAALVVTSLVPLYRWSNQTVLAGIPVLGIHGLFYAICYGLGAFIAPDIYTGANMVNEPDIVPAQLAAIVSWLCVLVGYQVGRRVHPKMRLEMLQIEAKELDAAILFVVYPASAISCVVARSQEVEAVLQVVLAIRLFAFVWIVYEAMSGRLSRARTGAAFLLVVPAELILFSGLSKGFLVGLLVYGVIFGVSYALARNRAPVLLGVSVVVLFGLLTPIKDEFRQVAGAYRDQLDPISGFALMSDLLESRYAGSGSAGHAEGFEKAFSRINHLLTVAAVIADTPASQPFRHGETLLPLLTKWIPRAVWSDKPMEVLGNTWAKDYGYISLDDDVTSYNLPWVAEMYMNFGWLGVVAISLALGALMGALAEWWVTGTRGPGPFALSMTLASAFFFPESNISGQLGSLIVSGGSIIAFMFGVSRVLGRERAGTEESVAIANEVRGESR